MDKRLGGRMEASELERALLAAKPFKYLDIHELNAIKMYCDLLTFKDNEFLFEQGKKSDSMSIIVAGSAFVVAKVLGKSITKLDTLEQGDFFGEVCLIQKETCAATVVANGEVKCLQLTTVYFDMLALFFPEIRYKIMKAISEEICIRLRNLQKNIITIMDTSRMIEISFKSKWEKFLGNYQTATYSDQKIDIEFIKNLKIFETFKSEEVDELLQSIELIQASNYCQLIKTGIKNTGYFIILRGAVQLTISSNNKIAKLSVLGPSSIFGGLSFIDNQETIINYTTCERAELLKITDENLKKLENENPELWYKVFNVICQSLVMLERSANKLIIRLNNELYNG